jgi:GNAT superfamily N-acetyltransferase
MAKRQNLSVEKLKPEDAHLYQQIRHTTFAHTINKIIYTREPSAETQRQIAEKAKEDIEKGVLFMVCRDNDTGEIIAGARWRYVGPKNEETDPETGRVKDRTWEEVEEGLNEPHTHYPETNVAGLEALFKLFGEQKREILGTRPYFVLDTLVTHPNHHRRGAGGLLVAWGCEQADAKGVEAYLEASPMGKPLYARFGFEEVRTVRLDMGDKGGEEVFEFIVSVIVPWCEVGGED